MADTRENIYTRKRFWAGILLAQFLLFYIYSQVEFIIDLLAFFFEWQKVVHQKLFTFVPFSAGDVLYVFLGLAILWSGYQILRKTSRNSVFIKVLIGLNILYFIYQLFWGMLYFQKPILEKLPQYEITIDETKKLTLKYLDLALDTRKLVTEDENGVFKITNLPEIKTEILQQQKEMPGFINDKNTTETNAFKPSLFSGLMSYSGILGYYNPFTAEAQYNSTLPHTYIPFTLAHESAHQLGYAREQEANFVAYLIGRNTPNAALRYSTEYSVLKSLLNALTEKDPEFVKWVLKQYSPAMLRDRKAEKDFVAKHQGWLDVFFGFTNDLFLKSNQQEGSVTYSYFVDLLIRMERLEGK